MVATAVPVLPVDELDRSLAHYGRLGFSTVAVYDAYAIVSFDGAELHLSCPERPAGLFSWSGVYLRVADADAVHAAWVAAGASVLSEPSDAPYGMREFAAEDPDGNLLRIGSPLAAPDSDPVTDTAPSEAMTAPDPAEEGTGDGEPPTDGSPGTTDASWLSVVEDTTCAGCGLTASEGSVEGIGARLVDGADRWRVLLDRADDDAVRHRPDPATWSALEYAVHVRDALGVFRDRIARMLAEPDPELGWWDHEAAIDDGMANELDVGFVGDDLQRVTTDLTAVLAGIDGTRWQRAGTRRGERFTVETTARYALHELVHHREDAARSLAAADPASTGTGGPTGGPSEPVG